MPMARRRRATIAPYAQDDETIEGLERDRWQDKEIDHRGLLIELRHARKEPVQSDNQRGGFLESCCDWVMILNQSCSFARSKSFCNNIHSKPDPASHAVGSD